MNAPTSSVDGYQEAASTLTPPAVSQYLATHDWVLESQDQDIREIWSLPGEDGPLGRVMVPLATDYVDFSRRFQETLRSLALINGWDAVQLFERITATRSDVFYVRLDQEMIDGTIPFRQAEDTLNGLFRLMKAAATTADDPTHSHRGRRSSTVTEFLEDDVRLGHTKAGSFVFTVVARLGDPLPAHEDGSPAVAFPRRVMTTLARGLEATRDLALNWNEQALEQSGQLGLSASLVEAVLELTEPDSLRALDMSFDWAAAEPLPQVNASRIVLNRDTMAGLPRVRERLVRREEPARRETLVGVVKTLNRDELGDGDEEATSIILATHVNGRPRKVHVPLSGDEYDLAIIAHRSKRPVIVTGDLVFERGAWRLVGPIELDASYVNRDI